jgi:hypothetical protein
MSATPRHAAHRPRLLILAFALLAVLAAALILARTGAAHLLLMHYFGRPAAMHYHG